VFVDCYPLVTTRQRYSSLEIEIPSLHTSISNFPCLRLLSSSPTDSVCTWFSFDQNMIDHEIRKNIVSSRIVMKKRLSCFLQLVVVFVPLREAG
jgi:hypothetical protein